MFNISEIKPGYLLKVTNVETNATFNMTVICNVYASLGCCCPGVHWWDIECFNDDLEYFGVERFRIDAVYGRAPNRFLLDNTIEYRDLIWERKQVKKMTIKEIEAALGYQVEIVEDV